MIDRRRLSRSRPAGGPGEWPIADYNAFMHLLAASDLRDEEHPVDRVTIAATELRLPDEHWVVQEVLLLAFRKFPIHGGRYYAEDAEAFLRNATTEDLRDRENYEFAKRLVRDLEEALSVLAEGTPDDLTDRQLRAWVDRLEVEIVAHEASTETRASRAGRRRHND